jgi:hypothetical protein
MAGQPSSGFQYLHANANVAATNIKSSPGTLFTVNINSKGATANLLTLYDTSGTSTSVVIAVIDTTSQVGTLRFMLDFKSGLAYALAAGTAADITISYS